MHTVMCVDGSCECLFCLPFNMPPFVIALVFCLCVFVQQPPFMYILGAYHVCSAAHMCTI